VIKSRVATVSEGFQVLVWIPEQPDLFARICEYFDLRGISVLDARVTTTRGGWALDQFFVTQPEWAETARDILNLIETELLARLASPEPMGLPVRGRPSRRSRFFPVEPAIELVPDGRGERWLLSVRANDRTGLLYAIARVFAKHQINLHTARITTLGERAEDTFLVEGAALATGNGQIQFQTDLLAALAGP
jgi:[protein-PII] uridylyltransferase